MSDGLISFGLWISFILCIVSVVAMAAFPVMHIAKDPKGAKGTFIGLGALLIIFLLSYAMSSGEVYEKYDVGASQAKLIGAGLITLYIIGIGSIIIGVVIEVKNLVKK